MSKNLFCLALLLAGLLPAAQAARTINSATVNGAASITVAPGASITAALNVTTTVGPGVADDNWRGSHWRIATTPPGTTTCNDHNDIFIAGSWNQSFSITAPLGEGTYNAYFIAYDNNTCSIGTGASNTLTLANAVTVAVPPYVVSINRASTNPAEAGSAVSWTVTFSESVTGVDAGDFALVTTLLSGTSITSVSGSGTTWTVTADTGSGAGTLGLNLVDNNTIVDSMGNVLVSSGGAANGSFTGQVYVVGKLVEYRMEQTTWAGSSGEVIDSAGNYNATAATLAGALPSTTNATPAISGSPGTCRYGIFNRTNKNYLALPAGFPNLGASGDAFTITAWIRTTNNTQSGQRIMVDDENNSSGWGFSLGDNATGQVRFFTRGINQLALDSAAVVNNNTWYFVAAVADVPNKTKYVYVFNTSGTLLSSVNAPWTTASFGQDNGNASIGGETNSSGENTNSFGFNGNLDYVRVYRAALDSTTLNAVRQETHPCITLDHVEFIHDANGHTCTPEEVTIYGCNTGAVCKDTPTNQTSSPFTIVPVTPVGTTWCTTPLCAPADIISGSATVNNGQKIYLKKTTTGAVTLSGTSSANTSAIQCYNTTASNNSCGMDFYDAGFIFTNSVSETTPIPATAYNIASQIAGVSSATTYLRAVRTNAHTKACEAALVGNTAVELAYECNSNPSTCHTTNLLSVTGGTPSATTTLSRNNTGTPGTYQSVTLTFDANGNAPFTFNYADVGIIRLWARKTPSGALNTTLSGSSNTVVVKPHNFGFGSILCGITPNPVATDPSGGKFCPAGNPFSLILSARTASNAVTPSFGRCDGSGGTSCTAAAATVDITHSLVAPSGGSSGTLNGTKSFVGANFNGGSVTTSNLSWSEVGIIGLRAGNANYLNNNLVACGANPSPGDACRDTYGDSGNIGRFYPSYFKLTLTPPPACSNFVYGGRNAGTPGVIVGQPFTVTATARNAYPLSGPSDTSTTTTNYYHHASDTNQRYAKAINLSLAAGGGAGSLYVGSTAGGTGAIPASTFTAGIGSVAYNAGSNRISYVFNASPTAHTALTVHADDADTATSAATGNAGIEARFGRLRLFNAFGSEKTELSMAMQTQYWTGNSWVINPDDSCTPLTAANIYRSSTLASIKEIYSDLLPSGKQLDRFTSGKAYIVFNLPGGGATGSMDVAAHLGISGNDQSCLTPATNHGGSAASLAWLRAQNGSCTESATWASDPSARASFGIYSPETRKTIHVREQLF